MKYKSVIGIFICVLLLSFLLGSAGAFKLAETSSAATTVKDKLAGVFVTREYLDTFDTDAYFNDNIEKILSGKEISNDKASEYNQRLYATTVDKEMVNESTGKVSYIKDYVFEGIEGVLYYVFTETDEAGNQMYSSGGGSEGITDGHTNIAFTDDGESISLTGTIYTSVSNGSSIYYINPVYQTESGEIYAVDGNGISQGGDLSEGMNHSVKIKEDSTTTINGEISSYSSSIEVTIAYMLPPEKIIITQMSDDNKVLSREEYAPGSLPDEIKADENTGYIIVESCKKATDGSITTKRELYQSEDEYLYAFYCREDGICVKQSSQIKWR